MKIGALTAKQLRAVAALAAGATYERAAKLAHCSKRSIVNWTEQPVFAEAVKAARPAAFARTMARAEAGASEAVDVMRAGNRMTAARAAKLGKLALDARLSSARALLSFALKAHELLDLSERVAAVEKRIGQEGSE